MSVLTCPVCRGTMREVAHQGVHIDTCTQCRGVWLDRGELEKIAAAVGPTSGYAAHGPQRSGFGRDHDDDDDDHHRRHRSEGSDYDQRQKKSGMGRFLDFFD